MNASSSPSTSKTRSPLALTVPLELPLAHELKSSGRCSFEARDRFSEFERALADEVARAASPRERDIRQRSPSYRMPREAERYPPFATAAARGAVAARLALATQAAQQNADTTRTPYRAPTTHEFREATSPRQWTPAAGGRDFQTKFVVPSNQDVRRSVARDQEGFFGAAPGEDVLATPISPTFQQQLQRQQQAGRTSRSPSKSSSPARPAFSSHVAHTSRKSANAALRLEMTLDQEGLLPQLQEVRQHKYRAEVSHSLTALVLCLPFMSLMHRFLLSCAMCVRLSKTTPPIPFLGSFRPASPLQPMSPQ
ncbi:hypothetical protein BBJ28_00017503 [Nothophytophthora sp. Chile5]|nr:hypothetical protein BBJ28_00017503 [Nothophytophthora sp. Chile5]